MICICLAWQAKAQNATITGQLLDDTGNAVIYANIALYSSVDSSLVKVETSDESGAFEVPGLTAGTYDLNASFIGLQDLSLENIEVKASEVKALGTLEMLSSSVQLETAVVTARRSMVEIKSDRTVFNVQGTINSSGDNGIDLLRKAPGVLVDNNDNITVLGRTGVLFYVDGKRLPLSGDDLRAYLQNLNSEQIDKIDIITNPGAKYEAEGNAGIIDIRLKRNENYGTNGSINSNVARASTWRNNLSGSLNHRNSVLNTFGQLSLNKSEFFQNMIFDDYQNGVRIQNDIENLNSNQGAFLRWGTDFNIGENQTIGFLVSGNIRDREDTSDSYSQLSSIATADQIDSILVAESNTSNDFNSQTYNINYVFNGEKSTLNLDADYGRYRRESDTDQPNTYFMPDGETVTSIVNTAYSSPNDIDIMTFKADYETDLAGGRLGVGTKLSCVETDNTFLFYEVQQGTRIQDDRRSNLFFYDENVFAGYANYSRALTEKININGGLRVEKTDARGDLQAFLPELQEPPVDLNYTSYIPSAGLSYTMTPEHVFSINYGRRINRPDYNVLNPFKSQINELSFSKGNPFLQPEIVNNIELGYLLKYRFNFKLAYSKTTDQITRLIGPDDSDPRARFINWDNLAEQTVFSFNVSAPIQMSKAWNAYVNISATRLDNQADYGDGVIIDLQAFTYNIYQQHSFTLPKGFVAEVSGWFNGPGVWGGVFEYDTSWSLNLGLQKRFLDNKLNVRLSAQDIFNQAYWSGSSMFNGLRSVGEGYWDARRVSMSLSYNFGNQKVKSRDRQIGLEEEASSIE